MNRINKLVLAALCGSASVGFGTVAQAQNQQPAAQVQVKNQPAAQTQNQQPNATQVTVGPGGVTVYNGIRQTPWFSNQGVRQQLRLNDNQYNQLNQAYGQSWNQYNQGVTGLDANLTEQQRMQRQQELAGTFHREFSDTTGRVFTDPNANQRYNQMYLQYQGYGAFNDPTVQTRLNLTPEQRQKFHQYNRDWNRQMNEWHRTYATDPNAVNTQFTNYQQQYQNNVQTTLTPEQQQTWTQMRGQPYTFTPDVYFGNNTVTTTTTSKPVLK